MRNLINLGWYKGRTIYYDESNNQLCVSDIEKDVNVKSFYIVVPLLTTLANVIVNIIGATTFQGVIHKLVLFAMGSLIAFLGSHIFVNTMRNNLSLKELNINRDELENLLDDCHHHRKVVETFLIAFSLLFIFFVVLYILISADLRLLMISSILFLCISILIIEYSPIKRRRALNKIRIIYHIPTTTRTHLKR